MATKLKMESPGNILGRQQRSCLYGNGLGTIYARTASVNTDKVFYHRPLGFALISDRNIQASVHACARTCTCTCMHYAI